MGQESSHHNMSQLSKPHRNQYDR
ncbi:hypothetical protein MED222_05835 [Vibrio sp. MED222]|nr:hypothetical protein MED222_05835 [Vibrio sp. MED222]